MKDNVQLLLKTRENCYGANHKCNQQFKWCEEAYKAEVLDGHFITHSECLGLLATLTKEQISMEYLGIRVKTPTRYFTLQSDGDSREFLPEFLENQLSEVLYMYVLRWIFSFLCLFLAFFGLFICLLGLFSPQIM